MHNFSLRSIIINIALIIFITGFSSFLSAGQESSPDADQGVIKNYPIPETTEAGKSIKQGSSAQAKRLSVKEEDLTQFQKQAREYRVRGLELQRMGNLDGAMVWYQKAIQLDPAHAVTYNDLGIVCEAKGLTDRAEGYYLLAIKADPDYLSPYTNLAYVYEGRRDLQKALTYWKKRYELGSADDPWTQKARRHMEDIGMISSKKPFEDLREQEVVSLVEETAVQKLILKREDKALAGRHFQRAMRSYDTKDYATAIREALNAMQLDPANPEIEKFIEKVQNRALSR